MAAENVERFATGAVRGTAIEGRYDLIPLVGLRRLAETCAEGARKYGENNWARGIPSSNVINHALAHIANYLDGDRTEDHLAHAAWGLFVAMHNEERRPDVHFPPPPATPEEIREVLKEYKAATSSDAEVNGLPSNLGRGIKDPTAGERYPLDAAMAVLEDVVRTCKLPDGRPVKDPCWSIGDLSGNAINFRLNEGGTFIAEAKDCGGDPWITVDEIQGGFRVSTEFSIELAEVLRGAISSRLHASSPSGPHSHRFQDPSIIRDAALEVFHEIQDSRRLPDGTQVESVNLSGFGDSGCVIQFLLEGRQLRAKVVRNPNDPYDWGIACEDHTADGFIRGALSQSTARVLSEAVSSRLHASSPSGPNSPGLQRPGTPASPADQDFDEWMALKTRVDAANICPWVDDRTQQWCARDPRDGTVHFFGPSESDRDSAYRWADNILSRSHHEPHRETRP
jgi:hypothetical protein